MNSLHSTVRLYKHSSLEWLERIKLDGEIWLSNIDTYRRAESLGQGIQDDFEGQARSIIDYWDSDIHQDLSLPGIKIGKAHSVKIFNDRIIHTFDAFVYCVTDIPENSIDRSYTHYAEMTNPDFFVRIVQEKLSREFKVAALCTGFKPCDYGSHVRSYLDKSIPGLRKHKVFSPQREWRCIFENPVGPYQYSPFAMRDPRFKECFGDILKSEPDLSAIRSIEQGKSKIRRLKKEGDLWVAR